MKIYKNDEVVVIAGKDKGKRGVVRIAMPDKDKVVVEGVNVAKKHQRPRQGVRQAGIIDQENPIHVSNVQLQCPRCNLPTRVAQRRTENGSKQRCCRHCNETVDRR